MKLYKYIDIDPIASELYVLNNHGWQFVDAFGDADAIIKILKPIPGYHYSRTEDNIEVTVTYYLEE